MHTSKPNDEAEVASRHSRLARDVQTWRLAHGIKLVNGVGAYIVGA